MDNQIIADMIAFAKLNNIYFSEEEYLYLKSGCKYGVTISTKTRRCTMIAYYVVYLIMFTDYKTFYFLRDLPFDKMFFEMSFEHYCDEFGLEIGTLKVSDMIIKQYDAKIIFIDSIERINMPLQNNEIIINER